MILQVEFAWLVGLLLAFFAACAAAGQMFLTQSKEHLNERFALLESARKTNDELAKKHLDERFTALESARVATDASVRRSLESIQATNREEANQWQRVERELLNLKAEMPLHYVRREDYIRGQSVIEAKLDGIAMRFENMQLHKQISGGTDATN